VNTTQIVWNCRTKESAEEVVAGFNSGEFSGYNRETPIHIVPGTARVADQWDLGWKIYAEVEN